MQEPKHIQDALLHANKVLKDYDPQEQMEYLATLQNSLCTMQMEKVAQVEEELNNLIRVYGFQRDV